MKSYRIKKIFLLGVMTCSLLGCATSGINPNAIPKDSGAFFGHIEVFNKTDDVTSTCYAEFTDADENRKAYISVDKNGWVFGSGKIGDTYLSKILCRSGGLLVRLLEFNSRDLKFDIEGSGQIIYFGHVRLQMDYTATLSPAYLFGGLGAAVAASDSVDATKQVQVLDKTEIAQKELSARYGETNSTLTLRTLLIPEPPKREPATEQK